MFIIIAHRFIDWNAAPLEQCSCFVESQSFKCLNCRTNLTFSSEPDSVFIVKMVFSFVILSTQNIVNHFNLSGESEMFLNSIEKKVDCTVSHSPLKPCIFEFGKGVNKAKRRIRK